MFEKFFKKDIPEFATKNDLLIKILKDNLAVFANLLNENDSIVIFIVDDDNNIKYVNKGFLKITNYTDEPVGKNLREFVSKNFNELLEMLDHSLSSVSLDLFDFKNKVYICLKGIFLKASNYSIFIVSKNFYRADKLAYRIIESTKEANKLRMQLSELESQLKETVSELTYKDVLTNIYNRRYCEDYLKTEIEKCKRYKTFLSIILIDIDNFKSINATYGRSIGDLVLKSFAKLLQETLRDVDIVIRYEEDKFLIILPNTNYDGANKLIERIKKKVERTLFEKAFYLTLNAVAVECNELDDIESLINRAFALLKEKKYLKENNEL